MIDSLYYMLDIACLIFLYIWSARKEGEDDQ